MQKSILEAFLYNHKLKFNEIEKLVKERSNKLAYHIKSLIKKGVIEKDGEYYRLSETSETIIPFLSDKKPVLAVLLIALEKNKKIFLYKRDKRPFRGKFSLPGGRMIVGESIPQSTKRLMKKFNINCTFKKINSISLEHVKRRGKTLHSFLLIFVSATTKEDLKYLTPNKAKTISSDYNLIKEDLGKEIKINNLKTLI